MESCVESWFVMFDCWLCCFVAPWYAYTWTILVRLGNHSNRYKLLFQSLIFKMLIKRAHYLDVVTIDSLCPGWSLFYFFHHATPLHVLPPLCKFFTYLQAWHRRGIYSCWLSNTKFSAATCNRRPHWRVFYRHHLKAASLKRWICSSDNVVLGLWLFWICLYVPLAILHHFPRDASSPVRETSQWPYFVVKAMRSLKRSGALLFLLFPDLCWIASKWMYWWWCTCRVVLTWLCCSFVRCIVATTSPTSPRCRWRSGYNTSNILVTG